MGLGSHPDVIVDQEYGIAVRAVDARISLHGQAARRWMDVVQLEAGGGTELLDLGPRGGLLARVHYAELRGQNRLLDQAAHGVRQSLGPVAGGDDETRTGSGFPLRHAFSWSRLERVPSDSPATTSAKNPQVSGSSKNAA